ncbi:MAG: ATP-binding protein [Chloroflexi bacterium]|nr:ATP-binding protein [Chloroflexota bacterium]
MSIVAAGMPAWAQEFLGKLRSGVARQFLLHFNISDYFPLEGRYVTLREYLGHLLRDQDVVAFYNRSGGVSFMGAGAERRFRALAGLDEDEVPAGQAQELKRLNIAVPAPSLPRDPSRALALFERALQAADGGRPQTSLALVIEYSESLLPAGDLVTMSDEDRTHLVTLQRWALEPGVVHAGSVVVLTASNLVDVHASLRAPGSRLEAVRIPLPDREERHAFVQHLLASDSFQLEMTSKELANVTAGLSLQRIEGLLLQARGQGQPLTFAHIKRRKKEVLDAEFGGLVEILEPRFGLEALGGLEGAKDYFRGVVRAIHEEDTKLVPMGVILMGPPGTGKTALVEALAFECGFGFAKILNPRERWVGQSERNFWRALMALQSLAPVVVLEDEADQSEQSRDEYTGDSGVSNRMRQMRFTFTSDPAIRGKVLWVRITNRPDKLDIADKRSGRSSERIPLLMPDEEEQALIFAVMPAKHDFQTEVRDFSPVVQACRERHGNVLSGADIEEVSLRAYQRARREGRTVVREGDYRWAVEDFISLLDPDAVLFQELLAVTQCSSRRFLPKRYLEMADKGELARMAKDLAKRQL